ncbi:MAG TPA: FxLYD domain-containing protein, partial [Burkholderiales bacterium]|nr:FxLYD domain-containing protein [Burkholderiales bacterium]
MLAFLKRLGIGFTYGIGFALGIAGILALTVFGGASYVTSTSGRPVYLPSPIPSEPRSKPDQFVISDTSTVKTRWGGISVLGTIDNTGEDTPRYVNVYADLFDKNGKFIYQCMHQFNEGLRKGQRANFMIQCHGMPAELATR